ncbi:hypothetical protein L6164_016687 [Bauhinia variegata]|uniref:Uncharacterized protein n=1 Tax=Bauhinia variegata TaxID=167791 RepID=A0ACB9NPP3_BAUVA|nr:hypothetical protein L6164_016687 [Bauhinia variegata]
MCNLCTFLKSLWITKIRDMFCFSGTQYKHKRLDVKIEKKIAEMKRHSFKEISFKSIDSIVIRFPQFKKGLKTLMGMFEQYDVDGNGFIDQNELKICLEQLQLHLPEKEIEDIFHYCDIDESEGIQFNEFIVLLCVIYLLEQPPSTDNSSKKELAQVGAIFNMIVEAFLLLDKNGDGKLDKKDLIRTMNESNPWERSPAHITELRFQEMDWDKNGQVNFKEFLFGFIKWIGIDADEEMHQVENDDDDTQNPA